MHIAILEWLIGVCHRFLSLYIIMHIQRYESKQRTSQVSFSAIEESKHIKGCIIYKKGTYPGNKELAVHTSKAILYASACDYSES